MSDSNVSFTTVLSETVRLMKLSESMKTLNGAQKKQKVLDTLKQQYGLSDDMVFVVSHVIDLCVSFNNNEIKLDDLKKYCCF